MTPSPSAQPPPDPRIEPDDDALTEALTELLLADWARRHATEAGDVVDEDAAS